MQLPSDLKAWLDQQADKYEQPSFISNDPIQVPHLFSKKQDIEIAAFFSAILAWGNRKIIIRNSRQLMRLMDDAPHDFIANHQLSDLQRFEGFVHRTFQYADLRYCLRFLQDFYKQHQSLETAFAMHLQPDSQDITDALIGFHNLFFGLPQPEERTRKHIATPARKSACKRLCMLLMWLVRPNDKGVELGIWKKILPRQLIIPLDVHVNRVGRYLGLLDAKSGQDWKAAQTLTAQLRKFDPVDPTRYDFALFAVGEDLGKAAFDSQN